MAPPDLTARPFGISEIVDRSIVIALRHFRALFVAMLIVQAPALLLAHQLPPMSELIGAVGDPERGVEILERASRSFSILLVSLIALQLLATSAAAAIVAPSLDPRWSALRPTRIRMCLATLGAAILQLLFLAAAPVVGALPGLVLTFLAEGLPARLAGMTIALAGSLVLLLVVMLRLMLAPAVSAVEGRAGLAALVRSVRLMSPSPGSRLLDRPGVRASLVLLAMFVLALAVNGLAGIPRLLALQARGTGGAAFSIGAQLPLALEVAVSLIEAVAAAALQPFSLVAVVVFYFDRRARAEGLDLELWADHLENGP